MSSRCQVLALNYTNWCLEMFKFYILLIFPCFKYIYYYYQHLVYSFFEGKIQAGRGGGGGVKTTLLPKFDDYHIPVTAKKFEKYCNATVSLKQETRPDSRNLKMVDKM